MENYKVGDSVVISHKYDYYSGYENVRVTIIDMDDEYYVGITSKAQCSRKIYFRDSDIVEWSSK